MMNHFVSTLGSMIFIAIFLVEPGLAQELPVVPPANDAGLIRRQDWEEALSRAPDPAPRKHRWLITAGPGKEQWHNGWPYGPAVAPPWGYYGLGGGPFVGYPWGWPGYSGRAGQNWSNGLSLYGPPVPVYGPVPGIIGNNDLVKQWHDVPSLGIGYGWFGIYGALPHGKPRELSVWPAVEPVQTPVVPAPAEPQPTSTLMLSVKVPQPAAEVFVDGVKTTQTGTDRLFESPPLEAGKKFQYEITVRWIEGGQKREVKKAVIGSAGEVVRVDFTGGN